MSDDYDRVVKCFEDVKQYLGRLKILEENVELTAAIKKAIIDVFTSLLALFGIFAKYTKIRRTSECHPARIPLREHPIHSHHSKLYMKANTVTRSVLSLVYV